MKIRSITYFLGPGWPIRDEVMQQAGAFIAAARPAFSQAGYEVQSVRLASTSFTRLVPSLEVSELVRFARELESAAKAQGFEYLSLGPAQPDLPESYSAIPEMLASTGDVFLSGLITSTEGVSLPAIRRCARVIVANTALSLDGFGNLRFCAMANVPGGGPFLPMAYHAGGPSAFALATESADLAVEAFSRASSLAAARQDLVGAVEGHARNLTRVAQDLSSRFDASFGGIDFTLAPFPERALSFGEAMERLGAPAVGQHGSLAAAAILADTLDRARYPRAGFNGLMLPVLEDAVLAQRAAEGLLTVKDILLYSAVCGTGLDTVPLPGDVTEEQIAAILVDVGALSQRLRKPLTARLMPVPGKRAGDQTSFDFTYFANSRVLAVDAAPLAGLFTGDETFDLQPRDRPLT